MWDIECFLLPISIFEQAVLLNNLMSSSHAQPIIGWTSVFLSNHADAESSSQSTNLHSALCSELEVLDIAWKRRNENQQTCCNEGNNNVSDGEPDTIMPLLSSTSFLSQPAISETLEILLSSPTTTLPTNATAADVQVGNTTNTLLLDDEASQNVFTADNHSIFPVKSHSTHSNVEWSEVMILPWPTVSHILSDLSLEKGSGRLVTALVSENLIALLGIASHH
jgi:hypothetical protein